MPRHGGERKGAGRPRRSAQTVSHARRPAIDAQSPLHVTMRAARGVWNLRSQRAFRVIARALAHERDLGALRVVHYSVQGNHLHLVVEAGDNRALARRMQGLSIRLAKGLNAMMERRRGKVFAERYHARVLRSPREVRTVIRYVLLNRVKHAAQFGREGSILDPFSSAEWFDGFRGFVPTATAPPLTSAPESWLLEKGWRRLGLIEIGA